MEYWKDYWLGESNRKSAHSEHIVRFSKKSFSSLNGLSVMEIGFGDVRELLFFLAHKCTCYGIEASDEIAERFLNLQDLKERQDIHVGTLNSITKPKLESLDITIWFTAWRHYTILTAKKRYKTSYRLYTVG